MVAFLRSLTGRYLAGQGLLWADISMCIWEGDCYSLLGGVCPNGRMFLCALISSVQMNDSLFFNQSVSRMPSTQFLMVKVKFKTATKPYRLP